VLLLEAFDDVESYARGCGRSDDYDDQEDLCQRYDIWGGENHECVCDENGCNQGHIQRFSLFLVTLTLLAFWL